MKMPRKFRLSLPIVVLFVLLGSLIVFGLSACHKANLSYPKDDAGEVEAAKLVPSENKDSDNDHTADAANPAGQAYADLPHAVLADYNLTANTLDEKFDFLGSIYESGLSIVISKDDLGKVIGLYDNPYYTSGEKVFIYEIDGIDPDNAVATRTEYPGDRGFDGAVRVYFNINSPGYTLSDMGDITGIYECKTGSDNLPVANKELDLSPLEKRTFESLPISVVGSTALVYDYRDVLFCSELRAYICLAGQDQARQAEVELYYFEMSDGKYYLSYNVPYFGYPSLTAYETTGFLTNSLDRDNYVDLAPRNKNIP